MKRITALLAFIFLVSSVRLNADDNSLGLGFKRPFNASKAHITNLYVDHILEKTSGHKVVFDSDAQFNVNVIMNQTVGELFTTSGKINADYAEAATASDPTRYYDFRADIGATQTASVDGLATLYGRINWTKGDNSNATLHGVEGVASSASADESITLRGGYFRTYINANADATGSTARSSFGADISARAGYAGGNAVQPEAWTAFVGARIWMAPYFATSTSNINNFHGLWLYNEHPTIDVTNAIYINSATGGASWTNFINCRNASDVSMFNVDKTGNLSASKIMASGNISGTVPIKLDNAGATVVLTADSCKGHVRINNVTAAKDYTLPGAAAGLCIMIYDAGGGVITVDPVDGTDTIYLDGTTVGAGDAIDSAGFVGNFICLIAVDDTRWYTVGRSGIWVDGGAD